MSEHCIYSSATVLFRRDRGTCCDLASLKSGICVHYSNATLGWQVTHKVYYDDSRKTFVFPANNPWARARAHLFRGPLATFYKRTSLQIRQVFV